MKRTWTRATSTAVLVIFMLIGSVVPSSARPNVDPPKNMKKRTVYAGYNYVRSSNHNPLEYNIAEPIEVPVNARERWATITIIDTTGRPVGAEVGQDIDGDGSLERTWEVCGASDDRFRITPRASLFVNVIVGPCSDEAGSATSGKVQIDLYSPAPADPPTDVAKTERLETISYTAPGYYETTNGFGVNGVRVQSWAGEVYLKVASSDASGLPVRIQIFPGEAAAAIEICGSTDESVAFPEGSELRLRVFPGPCEDGTPAAATSGTIEVTLSNLP